MRRLTISLLSVLACGGGGQKKTESASVVRVDTLIISDSIGIELGDSNYMFGSIMDVDILPDGRIAVCDPKQYCILVYSAEGEFLERIGRQGEGPGEFLSPGFFEVLGDGSLCMNDGMLGWMRFDSDLNYFETFPKQAGSHPMQMIAVDSIQLVGIFVDFNLWEQSVVFTKSIVRWEASTPYIHEASYYSWSMETNQEDFMTDLTEFDLFPVLFAASDEQVFVAPAPLSDPLVLVFAENGTSVDTLFLLYTDVPKTAIEIEEEMQYVEEFRPPHWGPSDWEPLPYRPMITSLGTDSLGNLWVQRGTELTPVFDVFSPGGEQLYTAVLPDREDCLDWRFNVTPEGILAVPITPDVAPRVYMIEIKRLRTNQLLQV